MGAIPRLGPPVSAARLTAPAAGGRAGVAVSVAVLAWGCGNVLVKLVSFDGVVLSLYRLWIGFFLMAGLMRLAGRPVTMRAVRQALPGGLLFGVNVAMFFSALKLTSVADATLISALQPALVFTVAGPWFGEHVRPHELLWSAVALAGVAVVVLASAGTPEWSPLGDALALGAVVTFTGYFLVSKRLRATLGAVEYVAAMQLSAAIVVTPVALVATAGHPGGGHPLDWLWLMLIVCVSGVGGHLLVNWAHRYVDVSVSSLMMLGVPVVGAVAAWVVLGESLGPLQVVGGLITLAALAAVVRGHAPSPEGPPLEAVGGG
jgi:drug/metabolite transporter (DMT)-like permease